MSFTYQMSGSMSFTGCFKSRLSSINYPVRFAEGSIAYRCDKAQKGILEPIWIKHTSIRRSSRGMVIMYIDNMNAIYAEYELCSQGQAKLAAEQYLQAQIAAIDAAIAHLNCP